MRIVSGEYKGRPIRTLSEKRPGYRPATSKVRQALFSMLESLGVIWQETSLADLFAGSGSLGLEALSRGAEKTVFVEGSKQAAKIIARNLRELEVKKYRYELYTIDAFKFVQSSRQCFHLVFIDPPYGKSYLSRTIQMALESGLFADRGLVAAEVEASLEFTGQEFKELELVKNKKYGQTRILLWTVLKKR